MSPGSEPPHHFSDRAEGESRMVGSGRVSDPPLRLFQPLDGVPGHRVSPVIADHCIIATFSQTGHMAVENNPGSLGDSLMVMIERFSDALHAPRLSPPLPPPPLRKGGKVGGVWSFFPPLAKGG